MQLSWYYGWRVISTDYTKCHCSVTLTVQYNIIIIVVTKVFFVSELLVFETSVYIGIHNNYIIWDLCTSRFTLLFTYGVNFQLWSLTYLNFLINYQNMLNMWELFSQKGC